MSINFIKDLECPRKLHTAHFRVGNIHHELAIVRVYRPREPPNTTGVGRFGLAGILTRLEQYNLISGQERQPFADHQLTIVWARERYYAERRRCCQEACWIIPVDSNVLRALEPIVLRSRVIIIIHTDHVNRV